MVNTSRVLHIQEQELEEELASLSEQHAAVMKQRRQTRDERDRLLLKHQADDLLEQMNQVEEKLDKLETSENNFNQVNKRIDEKISEIDYREARCQVDNLDEQFQEKGGEGEALFFIDNFDLLAGKYFISEIIDKFKSQADDSKYVKIEIENKDAALDEWGLMQCIADYFNTSFSSFDTGECIGQVIDAICNSLQNNKVIILEIRNWDILYNYERLLKWFIREFWHKLIEKNRTFIKDNNLNCIKLITIISASVPLEDSESLIFNCRPTEVDNKTIIKLNIISPWEQGCIEQWLIKNNRYFKFRSKNQITRLATRIYQKSGTGIPCLVCTNLHDEVESFTISQK